MRIHWFPIKSDLAAHLLHLFDQVDHPHRASRWSCFQPKPDVLCNLDATAFCARVCRPSRLIDGRSQSG
jgi:hypothetical protein